VYLQDKGKVFLDIVGGYVKSLWHFTHKALSYLCKYDNKVPRRKASHVRILRSKLDLTIALEYKETLWAFPKYIIYMWKKFVPFSKRVKVIPYCSMSPSYIIFAWKWEFVSSGYDSSFKIYYYSIIGDY